MKCNLTLTVVCVALLFSGCAGDTQKDREIDSARSLGEETGITMPGEGEAGMLFPIIPRPGTVVPDEGFFVLDSGTKLVTNDRAVIEDDLALHLTSIIERECSVELKCNLVPGAPPSSGCIFLDLDGDTAVMGDEGYVLTVAPKTVTMSAAGKAGLFYAFQTFGQLLATASLESRDDPGSRRIRCCTIKDRPRFPWRGQLLDVSRHFLPLELVKKNIDFLAALKMNVFHWHLTDDQGWRVEIKGCPELTRIGAWRVDRNDEPWVGREPQKPGEKATYGGFYTQEEIRDVIEYAGDRFVTIVPEIDIPGHSRAAIASYPEISCDNGAYTVATGGIMSENTLCPGKERTFEVVEAVLDEVIALFPSEYIHIGGDECNKSAWEKCPDCQARKKAEGLEDELELQSYFIRRVERIINSRGRKMIGWDEILEGGLAPNAAVMSWRGEKGGIAAASAGHEVVMTPHSFCYLDLKQGDPELEPPLGYAQCRLSTAYSYDPVPAALPPERAGCILGTQGNLWGESIQREEHAFYMLFPRLFAIAEVGWTPKEGRQWDDFVARLEPHLLLLERRGIGYARSLYNVSVTASGFVAGKGVEVSLSTEHGRLPIHYTLDGSEPAASSACYAGQLLIDRSTVLRAGSFRNGVLQGKVTSKEIPVHKAAGKPVRFKNRWSGKYPGGEELGLTNCRLGTLSFHDGSWMGFEGDDLEATLDLGAAMDVSRVSLGCLETQNSWIFLPEEVQLLVSLDGTSFTSAGSKACEASRKQPESRKVRFTIEFPERRVRYLIVKAKNLSRCPVWHPGKGQRCWLFVDEIIVE